MRVGALIGGGVHIYREVNSVMYIDVKDGEKASKFIALGHLK